MRLQDSDDGISLIEVLFATVILGLAIVAIVGGFGATIRSGVLYRNEAKVETVLRTASETVVAQGFKGCVSGNMPTYTVTSPVDGHTVQVTGVSYWTGTNPAAFASNCSNQSNGLIRVSVSVTSPAPLGISESVDVFVRSSS